MARNLITRTVRRFKGLNTWETATNLGPEWAQDCLNVIPNSSGGISRLRISTSLSSAVAVLDGTGNIFNFQNSQGIRQVIAIVGEYVYRFDLDAYSATQINQDALNNAVATFVQSNNMLFVANGLQMKKWTGTAWQNWGIAAPAAPQVSIAASTGIADPVNAPEVSWIGSAFFDYPTRTYSVSFTWVDANGGETAESPSQSSTSTSPSGPYIGYLCRVAWPSEVSAAPAGAVGWNVYVDVAGGGARVKISSVLSPITSTVFNEYPNQWTSSGDKDAAPIANTTGSGREFTTGRKYKAAFGNASGHIGAASEESVDTGALTPPADVSAIIAHPDDDTQVDRIFLFCIEDGGNDYYLNSNPNSDDGSWPLTSGATSTSIMDGLADADLDHSIIAPLLNEPPPVGNYAVKWQGRIFVVYGQYLAYSGYERIFMGRPEESFPPRNRIHMAMGADDVSGMGALPAGIVVWSRSNEMFVFRGAVEDIEVDAPLQFSAFLEQLPYNEGCASHLSIAETPLGIVWLGADKTVKVWNGSEPPRTLSGAIYPLLRSITEGQESNCRGKYFNWLEKKWYVLAIPISPSTDLNMVLVIDLEPDQTLNAGAFPFAIGTINALEIVEDTNSKRQLVYLSGGAIMKLQTDSATSGGITT